MLVSLAIGQSMVLLCVRSVLLDPFLTRMGQLNAKHVYIRNQLKMRVLQKNLIAKVFYFVFSLNLHVPVLVFDNVKQLYTLSFRIRHLDGKWKKLGCSTFWTFQFLQQIYSIDVDADVQWKECFQYFTQEYTWCFTYQNCDSWEYIFVYSKVLLSHMSFKNGLHDIENPMGNQVRIGDQVCDKKHTVTQFKIYKIRV